MAMPVIGVTGCYEPAANPDKDLPRWQVKMPYIQAVLGAMNAAPMILPGGATEAMRPAVIDTWLGTIDGLLVTGSPSNVEPHHYKGDASETGTLHDPARDSYTLPLIRRAIELGVPLLAICRGHQELNVALGGSLHQKIHEVPGHFNHLPDKSLPIAEQFGAAHMVQHRPGGFFQQLMDCDESLVNSYHAQAINHLSSRLQAESSAPDGTIEAVTVRDAKNFALGVQWHPEWGYDSSETSKAIFTSFLDACRARQLNKIATPESMAVSA